MPSRETKKPLEEERRIPCTLIYLKDENEAEDGREIIKKIIDPVSLKMGVKRMKKVSHGG